MRKLHVSVIALALLAVACNDKNPVGPGTVETLERPPNAAPVVQITGPTEGTVLEEGTRVILTGTANDERGNVSDSLSWSSSLDGFLGNGAQVSNVVLSPGTHAITAKARDVEGLEGTATITVVVTAATQTPPTLEIGSPGDGSEIVAGTAVTFVASAADPEDGDLTTKINWVSSIDGDLGRGSGFTRPLSVGQHFIRAFVLDSDGLRGEQAVTIMVVPPPANEAPVIMITSPTVAPSVALEIQQGTTVIFTATAVDAEEGDLSSDIEWRVDDGLWQQTGASFTYTAPMADGQHSITARVIDSADTEAIVSILVTVCSGGGCAVGPI